MPRHTASPGLWTMKTTYIYNATLEASGKGQLQVLQRMPLSKMKEQAKRSSSLLALVCSTPEASLFCPCLVAVSPTYQACSQSKASPLNLPQGSCWSQLGAPSLQLTKSFPSVAWCLPSDETWGSRRGNTATGISLSKSARGKKRELAGLVSLDIQKPLARLFNEVK